MTSISKVGSTTCTASSAVVKKAEKKRSWGLKFRIWVGSGFSKKPEMQPPRGSNTNEAVLSSRWMVLSTAKFLGPADNLRLLAVSKALQIAGEPAKKEIWFLCTKKKITALIAEKAVLAKEITAVTVRYNNPDAFVLDLLGAPFSDVKKRKQDLAKVQQLRDTERATRKELKRQMRLAEDLRKQLPQKSITATQP